MMIEWLRITAVPLGVFLMGACIWGCIKNSVVWRSITCERRDVSIAPKALEMQPTELPSNSSRDESGDKNDSIVSTVSFNLLIRNHLDRLSKSVCVGTASSLVESRMNVLVLEGFPICQNCMHNMPAGVSLACPFPCLTYFSGVQYILHD